MRKYPFARVITAVLMGALAFIIPFTIGAIWTTETTGFSFGKFIMLIMMMLLWLIATILFPGELRNIRRPHEDPYENLNVIKEDYFSKKAREPESEE